MTAVSEPRAPHRTAGRAALAIASFGAFMAFLDATIVNVCFPAIQESFPDSSTGALAWVLNAYNLVFAAALVAGGRLADLVGRRRTFLLGVVAFTIASVLCAVAPTLGWLICWRVFQALGAALLVPASLGLVIQAASAEKRAHAVSMWGAAAALAAGLGPPIGGALIEVSGWRLAFLVNLPLGIAAGIAGMRLLDESRSPGRRRLPDLAGVGILAVSLALISLAIVQGPTWHWDGVRTLLAFGCGALLLVVVGWRSTRHPVPVVDPALLRIPTFTVANLATLAAGMGMYAYLLNHIIWLSYIWDYSLLTAGLAVAPSALVTAVVAARLGGVAERYGFRRVAVPGALVWAAGLWWFSERVGTSPSYVAEWLPGALLAGIGCGAVLPVLGSAAVAAVPGGAYATASSIVSAVRQLGGVLGVSLLVVVLGVPADPLSGLDALRDGWRFSMWCFVAAAVIALALLPSKSPVVEDAPELAAPALRRNDVVAVRRRTPEELRILSGLDAETRAALTARGVRREVRAGRVLMRQGDPGDSLLLVLSGRLTISKDGVEIADIGQGSVVGELAVFATAARSATVIAARDSVLLEVTAADVLAVLTDRPQAYVGIARALAQQVTQLAPRPRGAAAPSVIAILSVAGPAPQDVADSLVSALGRHLRVLSPGVVTAEGLERAERECDRVVLVAGYDDEDWRDFCQRHADCIVLVAEGDPRLPRPAEGCELVFRGAANGDRIGAWMRSTGARRVHQLDVIGLEPLAARLSGRSLGVALAGGGARALSHVGLLYELEAAGIQVDRVAGVSVGSYIGAGFAAGWEIQRIEEVMRAEFVQRKPVSDWTLPRYALSRGGRIRQATHRVFGDLTAEELPRELTVMATDLYLREAAVLRTGLLREITQASAAVPALLPPVKVGGRIYVDGAATGNLPVQALAAECVGPVLAANLAVGGGNGPRDRTNLRVPTLGDTLMRSLLLSGAGADEAAVRLADVVVTAQTRNVGLLEFHQIDAAIESGRAAGRAAVEALAALPAYAATETASAPEALDGTVAGSPL